MLSKSSAQNNFTVISDLLDLVQPKLKCGTRKSAAASGNVPPLYGIYQFASELGLSRVTPFSKNVTQQIYPNKWFIHLHYFLLY